MRIRERAHRNATLAFMFILPLFMASFAGNCNKSSNNKNATGRTLEEVAIDNMVTSKVRENLTASSQVSAVEIKIETNKLKVALDGTVKSDAERAEAIRIAGQTEVEKDGVKFKVKEVDASNLKVNPSP